MYGCGITKILSPFNPLLGLPSLFLVGCGTLFVLFCEEESFSVASFLLVSCFLSLISHRRLKLFVIPFPPFFSLPLPHLVSLSLLLLLPSFYSLSPSQPPKQQKWQWLFYQTLCACGPCFVKLGQWMAMRPGLSSLPLFPSPLSPLPSPLPTLPPPASLSLTPSNSLRHLLSRALQPPPNPPHGSPPTSPLCHKKDPEEVFWIRS